MLSNIYPTLTFYFQLLFEPGATDEEVFFSFNVCDADVMKFD